MRITIFGIKTLPAYAGADRVVERIVDHMPEHDFTIYLVRGEAPKLPCGDSRRYIYIPALRGKHMRAFSYFLLSALHFLVKGRADVAHVHKADFGLFCPLLRLKRVRVVGTCHGEPDRRKKWGRGARLFLRVSEWMFMRTCHAVTAVSAPRRKWSRPILIIPNGIDVGVEVTDGEEITALGVEKDSYVFFACGRLDATKGLHHLLDAYTSVHVPNTLLVVGDFSHDPTYSRAIEATAARDERVRLHRKLLGRAALHRALVDCAVFVFPSEIEAMSMMLLEAIAARAPVVCSDIAENRAIVGDDYPLLFRSADPAALATALRRALAADGSLRAELQSAMERSAAAYRWEEIAAAYEGVYSRVSGGAGTSDAEALASN